MGKHYNTHTALFQPFDCFVIQPIRKLFTTSSCFVEGTPQIVNLDEECGEGPVSYHFGNALTKGTGQINKSKQYQSTMTYQLTAVKKEVLKVNKLNILYFGYINSCDESKSERER